MGAASPELLQEPLQQPWMSGGVTIQPVEIGRGSERRGKLSACVPAQRLKVDAPCGIQRRRPLVVGVLVIGGPATGGREQQSEGKAKGGQVGGGRKH